MNRAIGGLIGSVLGFVAPTRARQIAGLTILFSIALVLAFACFFPDLFADKAATPAASRSPQERAGMADTRLAPLSELPPPTMDGAQNSENLAKRYPFDSRVRYLRFLFYLGHKDYEKADFELDLALATEDILNKQTPGAVLPQRFVYATYLKDRDRIDEARAVASPLCTSQDERFEPLRVKLEQAGLCF